MGNSSPGRVGVIRAAQFAAAAAFVLWPAPGWAQSKVEAEFTPAIAQKIAARPAPATVTTEDASALSAKGYVQIGTIRAEEPGNEARWATQELESAILKKAGEVGGTSFISPNRPPLRK